MPRPLDLACTPAAKALLIAALREYIERDFPAGSSDCALVARESLLDTARGFERDPATDRVRYDRRLRAFLQEALRQYRTMHSPLAPAVGAELEGLLDSLKLGLKPGG